MARRPLNLPVLDNSKVAPNAHTFESPIWDKLPVETKREINKLLDRKKK
jgi:hypothetical protein